MNFKIGVLADGFQLPFEQAIAESAKLGDRRRSDLTP